jgi:flagellum-specific peptidoglycan hydrolase FlgJ
MRIATLQREAKPKLAGTIPARVRNDVARSVREFAHPFARIGQLQQSIGTQAVQRLLQKKLAINQPGDEYEREADRIAKEVTTESARPLAAPKMLSGAGIPLQRKCSCGGTCSSCQEEEEKLQRKTEPARASEAVSDAPPIVGDVLRSPGQPLDLSTRAFFEPRFGSDFSRVRIHSDSRAAESARSVNALAYTVGRDIVFDSGRYAPRTSAGRQLLGHEFAHVMQQAGSAAGARELGIGQVDRAAEREATAQNASSVVAPAGRARSATGSSSGTLQRQQNPRPNALCNNTNAVQFVKVHRADAASVAQQLQVPTENVLGTAAEESEWGTSHICQAFNNFFGQHAPMPGETGRAQTAGGTWVSTFASFAQSASSFAMRYGNSIKGVSDPTRFAQALRNARFNTVRTDFVSFLADVIRTVAVRMGCP